MNKRRDESEGRMKRRIKNSKMMIKRGVIKKKIKRFIKGNKNAERI